MSCTTIIHRKELNGSERTDVPAGLFGVHFPLLLEPVIFAFAHQLSHEYDGGLWAMFTLSNGGFYMSPANEKYYKVVSPNGCEAVLSADALGYHGVPVCLQPVVLHRRP